MSSIKADTIESKTSDLVEIKNHIRTNGVIYKTLYSNSHIVDFRKHSFVWIENQPIEPITFENIPHLSSMRTVYLIIRSNGDYTFSPESEQNGIIAWPSQFPPVPSTVGKYDLFSFMTNGVSYFSTFAFNYDIPIF